MELRDIDHTQIGAVNTLVSEAFGYPAPHTFFDDFPVWASDRAARIGFFDQGKLVSHVGMRFCSMRTLRGDISMALIGAVATHTHYRGQGLSTRLLQEAIKRSEEQNCSWMLLWGSEHEFYKKLRFDLNGRQFRVPIATLPRIELPENPVKNSLLIQTGLTDLIFHFLCDQKSGIALSDQDRSWFFSHKTVKWFYIEKPFAFVAFERGMDLLHIVHEWGGDLDSLKILFSHILAIDPQATVLGRQSDLEKIGAKEKDWLEEYLCLARPTQENHSWDDQFWVSGLGAC